MTDIPLRDQTYDNDAILTPVNDATWPQNDAVPKTYERIFDKRARFWCINCGIVGTEHFGVITCNAHSRGSIDFRCNRCGWMNELRTRPPEAGKEPRT